MKAEVILFALNAMQEAEQFLKADAASLPSYHAYLKLSEARIKLQIHSGLNKVEVTVEA